MLWFSDFRCRIYGGPCPPPPLVKEYCGPESLFVEECGGDWVSVCTEWRVGGKEKLFFCCVLLLKNVYRSSVERAMKPFSSGKSSALEGAQSLNSLSFSSLSSIFKALSAFNPLRLLLEGLLKCSIVS